MTKEEFIEVFYQNIEVIYDIDLRIKKLEDYRLIILHMLTEMELTERGLLNDIG